MCVNTLKKWTDFVNIYTSPMPYLNTCSRSTDRSAQCTCIHHATRLAQDIGRLCTHQKSFTILRAMSHALTHGTLCEDPVPLQEIGSSLELPPTTDFRDEVVAISRAISAAQTQATPMTLELWARERQAKVARERKVEVNAKIKDSKHVQDTETRITLQQTVPTPTRSAENV